MIATESARRHCPYCGEVIELVIDCSVPEQAYIEDCQVCCRPITVAVRCSEAGIEEVTLAHENDA